MRRLSESAVVVIYITGKFTLNLKSPESRQTW